MNQHGLANQPKPSAQVTVAAEVGPVQMDQASLTLSRENERRLRESQAIARLGSFHWNAETNSVNWSDHPDGNTCFPYSSEGMQSIFHVAPVDVREDGAKVFEKVHPDDFDSFKESILRSASGLTLWEQEFRLKFDDGTERWVSGTSAPTREADGSTLWHGYVADITDRKQAEQNLIEAHAAAEAASLAKSAFLANMSHEIRTPLTAMLGFAEILGEEESTLQPIEHRTTIAETIKRAGTHLLTIINDILDLSKIEANKMTVEKVETSLLRLLNEVETLMLPTAHGKGVDLKVSLTSPIPDRIKTDPTRLRQRQRGSMLPILALTANAMPDDERKCLDAGCDDYTTKPINKTVLLSKCEKWLSTPPRVFPANWSSIACPSS